MENIKETYACPPGLAMHETVEELGQKLREAEDQIKNGNYLTEEEYDDFLDEWEKKADAGIAAQKSKEAVVV